MTIRVSHCDHKVYTWRCEKCGGKCCVSVDPVPKDYKCKSCHHEMWLAGMLRKGKKR